MTERYLKPESDPPSDPAHLDDTLTRIERWRAEGKATAAKADDHETRLRGIEGWPLRFLLAFIAGVAALTGIGVAAVQSLARLETNVDAISERLERLEDHDARTWHRVDTTTHASED